jgi:hypothetical protein
VSRVLAVLVAIGMVVGAVYLRGRIDDEDNGGASGNGGGNGQLVCDPVLEAACRAVSDDVVVEDAATTAERLLDADRADFESWVTPGPWPAMVDALRSSDGRPALFDDGGQVVASSRMALVAPPEAPPDWRAVGDAVGGGDLRLGWRNPTTGLGVLQVGAFAVGFFDGPDFATNDFDAAFTAYLDAIVDEAEVARDPLERRLQQGISFAEVVVSFQGEAELLLDEAAPGRRGDLRPLYPEPVVAVEAVLAGTEEGADDLRDALEEQGWDVPANGPGLPSPGVLAALWQEVRR